MNKSPNISKLAEALAGAQAEMPAVKMNALNPFLKNKYADLGAVIETTRPILTKHGLSISQFPTSENDRIGLTSILMHTSGEWIEDTIYISPSDSKGLSVAQSAGVVISYLRRYQWQSIIGVYSDEDTDGYTPRTDKPGKVDQPKTDRAKLINRYTDRLQRAAALGIDVKAWELTDKMTDNEIIKLGTALNAEIEKAGK